jgi:hypothetical protein
VFNSQITSGKARGSLKMLAGQSVWNIDFLKGDGFLNKDSCATSRSSSSSGLAAGTIGWQNTK